MNVLIYLIVYKYEDFNNWGVQLRALRNTVVIEDTSIMQHCSYRRYEHYATL